MDSGIIDHESLRNEHAIAAELRFLAAEVATHHLHNRQRVHIDIAEGVGKHRDPNMRKSALRAFVLSSIWVCMSWAGGSRVAMAGDQTLSVLGLEPAAGAPESVATAVTEALRQRITSTTGYRLIPGRDLVEVKLVFSCPDEAPPCMTQAAQSIGASRVIFGNVQPVGMDAFLVTLKLLDGDRGVVESWISEQVAKTQTTPIALRGPVQKWFATLTGQAVPGSLKLTGGVIGAAVYVDGAQAGLLGADGLTVTGVGAGQHQIVVSKSGYEKFERNVTLASGAAEKLPVQLRAIQGADASDSAAQVDKMALTTTQTEPDTAAPARTGLVVTGFLALGVGIAAGAFGAYSSYKVGDVNSKLDPYRRYPCASGGAIACTSDGKTRLVDLDAAAQQYVKDQQNTGDTYTTLQWVGYGVGAVGVVAGSILLYYGFSKPSETASNEHRSNLLVMPTFGPGSAGAAAYLAF
jgi:hypothetical protein